MSNLHLGIDVAKSTFEAALLDEAGKRRHKHFANDSAGFELLSDWLAPYPLSSIHVCLEATGTYSDPLARHLHEAGFLVSVVNPARTKDFARSRLSRNKTDRVDAKLIAQFCQSQQPLRWTPLDPSQQELRALTRHLEALLSTQQQQKNRLEAEGSELVRSSLQSLIAYLDTEIRQVQQQIQAQIDAHPTLKERERLLCSIPGIGPTTAAKLLSEVGQMTEFDCAGQAAAYAGLTPRQHQSGSSVHGRTRLCKTGNSRLRKALYLPAVVAMRYNPIIQALCQRLRARGKSPMVIVGAAMRKLLHLAYGVLKTRQPFDPNYAVRA